MQRQVVLVKKLRKTGSDCEQHYRFHVKKNTTDAVFGLRPLMKSREHLNKLLCVCRFRKSV